MDITSWLIVVGVSLLAGLDRTAVASVMLARPLVCTALLGYLLGVFDPAFQLGIMLELLWLMRIPVGASVAPDDTQAAIGAVVIVKLFAAQIPDHHWELLVFIALLVVVLAELGKCFDVWARHINEHLFLRAQRHLEQGRWRSLSLDHYGGLVVFATTSVFSCGFIIVSGSALLQLGLNYIDELALLFPVHGKFLAAIFPVTGIASILAAIWGKKTLALFVSGYVFTCLLLEIY